MTTYFCNENRAVYVVKWKVIVEPDRSQITMQYGSEKMKCLWRVN